MDEIQVLSRCSKLIEKLDKDAQKRVVTYLVSVVENGKMPLPVESSGQKLVDEVSG
jgi:mRNA-degrading endonuclease RelE of RelBE toxin-antitoxin system